MDGKRPVRHNPIKPRNSNVPIELAPHHLHRRPGRLYPRSGLCCLLRSFLHSQGVCLPS
jgi:hypothetical protein